MLRFAFCLLAALSLIACSRRVAPPITSISDEPPPPAEGPHHATFAPVADKVRPAVVVLATFDEHGKIVAHQHGFFISANGDLVAERSAMNNAASAVVKSADGHAYDIFGAYLRSAAPNFILLKTNARDVPHLELAPAADVAEGAPAAIVLSGTASLFEGAVSKRKRDDTGEWLKFEPPPPINALGAPVINEAGAVIGIVAQRKDTTAPAVFRAVAGNSSLLAPASAPPQTIENPPPPEKAEAEAEPPAEASTSPEQKSPPSMEGGGSVPSRSKASVTPAKVLARSGKLLYSPPPRYPRGAAWISWDSHRSGSFRVTFNSNGEPSDVHIVQSTGSGRLDRAAMEALRSWRAQPGKEWTATVPVDFRQ